MQKPESSMSPEAINALISSHYPPGSSNRTWSYGEGSFGLDYLLAGWKPYWARFEPTDRGMRLHSMDHAGRRWVVDMDETRVLRMQQLSITYCGRISGNDGWLVCYLRDYLEILEALDETIGPLVFEQYQRQHENLLSGGSVSRGLEVRPVKHGEPNEPVQYWIVVDSEREEVLKYAAASDVLEYRDKTLESFLSQHNIVNERGLVRSALEFKDGSMYLELHDENELGTRRWEQIGEGNN